MKYRIGLDIGIASIGWCAMETDESGEPVRIADLGVRIFDTAEHPKDGSALAVPRRQARGLRRLLRRRAHRVERVKDLLIKEFGEQVVLAIEKNEPIDLIKLRVSGLDERLTDEEIGRLCVYFVKHRGFRSSKKAGSKSKDEGVLLEATKLNAQKLTSGGYRTVGEMLFKDEEYSKTANGQTVYEYRNKNGSLRNTFLREDLKKEVELILTCQQQKGAISPEFIEKYLSIFTSQRSFDEGPGKNSPYSGEFEVGKCTFEHEYERAPKGAYSVEYFIALQKLNNLVLNKRGEKVFLTEEQRKAVIEEIKTAKEIKYTRLRKLLGLEKEEEVKFNLLTYSKDKSVKATENAVFVTMAKSYEIRKALTTERDSDDLDKIAEIISKVKSTDKQCERFKQEGLGLTEEEMKNLGGIDSTKFSHLSLCAIKKILPFLEEGYVYSEACEKAGYNHSEQSGTKRKLLKGEYITAITNEIGSPVVRRSFAQTLKVINALVLKYGSPVAVNIEVARELSKPFEERTKIKKDNEKRAIDNERLKNRIKEEFGVDAKGIDIVKYRLYEEQGCKCAYSGKPIDASRMFSDGTYVQVDHIIPYSRCFDDRLLNKVLVLTEENQNKRNCTPFEYLGTNEKRWEEFCALVDTFKFSYKKKQLLLRKNFDPSDEKEWKERNLNDTKYVSRLVYNTIRSYLELDESAMGGKRVRAVSGGITSYLRKMWGLSKIREEGDKHHALDATVIATVTDKHIYNITQYNKRKEGMLSRNGGREWIDEETGAIVTREVYDTLYMKKLPLPYESFDYELKIRMQPETEEVDAYGNVHKGIRQESLNQLVKLGLGYDEERLSKVKPIFVSRMPSRKAKGALHKATVYSSKFKEDKIIVKKCPLTELSLKDGEIEDYFKLAKESDPLLYEALKARLKEYDGDGKKAFAEEFYKPKADGTQGPLVRTVKKQEKFSIGLELVDKKGYVKNDAMVRTDVFFVDGKYYYVPIYTKDIATGKIPNKAIASGKEHCDWPVMDDKDFIFSLYKNDLIYVKTKKPFNLEQANAPKGAKKEKIEISEGFVYYKGIDSSTGAMNIITHDNSFAGRPSLMMALCVKKFEVDLLGNISEVKREKREIEGIKPKKKK